MIIGLTGGIGSGKSLVSEILAKEHGFSVIQTDLVAAGLMNENGEIKSRLTAAFGSGIYLPDGKLDRKKFASVIYGDPGNEALCNSIVHPAVWNEVIKITEKAGENARVALETALPGKQLSRICDRIWYVYSRREARIERLMKYRSYTKEYAETVIEKQMQDSAYALLADQVIDNSGSPDELREEIRKLL